MVSAILLEEAKEALSQDTTSDRFCHLHSMPHHFRSLLLLPLNHTEPSQHLKPPISSRRLLHLHGIALPIRIGVLTPFSSSPCRCLWYPRFYIFDPAAPVAPFVTFLSDVVPCPTLSRARLGTETRVFDCSSTWHRSQYPHVITTCPVFCTPRRRSPDISWCQC